MIEVEVVGVRVELPTNSPIVLLRERAGSRHVPIWVGAPEATAIAYAQQGVVPPRPLTHDLLLNVLTDLGHTLEAVEVITFADGIFYAELVIDGDQRISARPSDAIALALRAEVPIRVASEVVEEVGVTFAEEEDDEVEKFREFLENASADDFQTDPGDDVPREDDR